MARNVWSRQWLLTPFLVFSTLSCGDDVVGPERPQGAFDLVEIEGRQIPAYFTSPEVPGVDGYRTLYESSTIEIDGSSVVFRLWKSMEWPLNQWTDVRIEHENATLGVDAAGRLQITDVTTGDLPLTNLRLFIDFWRGDSLMVAGEAGAMLYLRR